MSSPELPLVRLESQIIKGRCAVAYTYQPHILARLLVTEKVASVNDLSDDFLRLLCQRATSAAMDQIMKRVERIDPTGAKYRVVLGNSDNEHLDLRSEELGYDIVKRLTPEERRQDALLCDPTYSPIDLELRVYDLPNKIARCILRTTVQPPNLA